MVDPLPTCPLCGATGTDPCRAVDFSRLPSHHEERRPPRFDPAQEATPIYAETVADMVCGDPEPYASADHGAWSLRAYDDDPEGHQFLRLVWTHDGTVVTEGRCYTYKVWTVLAHWTEDLPELTPAP